MKTHHLTLFEYDHWANSLLIDVMVEHEIIDDRIWSLMSHIIWAKQVWMKRIMQEDILGYAPFNLIPLDEMRQQTEQVHNRYIGFIASTDDYSTVLEYKNSRGDAWNSTYEDILTHIANHGTYHRGQIASRLKEIGVQPPTTDYIAYSRL